jgi:hypothetical protein
MSNRGPIDQGLMNSDRSLLRLLLAPATDSDQEWVVVQELVAEEFLDGSFRFRRALLH